MLAEESVGPDAARALYEQGVAAAERALGREPFAKQAGHFWRLVHTRPYMRARLGLARSLDDLGRREDAIAHYRDLIRLDASDCQGVRYLFLSALLLAGRDAEASTLLDQFDDPTAQWCYGRALSLFRREGDSRAARESLRAALRSNRHVPRFLTNEDDELHAVPTTYAPGTREEAMICDAELGEAWRETPGAVDWLRAHAPARRSGKRRRR